MFALITRRKLLQMSVGAAVATVAAGGGAVVLKGPAQGAKILSAEEMLTVRAIAEVLFPEGPMGIGGLDAGVAEEVDRLCSDWLDDVRRPAFRYVLRGLEWGTYASRGVRFSTLTVDERREVLEAWGDPTVLPRRLAADSVKVIFGMAYFRHPQVQRSMGYVRLCGGGAA